MIKMVIKVTPKENSMGILINKKLLMLQFQELCHFVQLVNTEIMRLQNQISKLTIQTIWFLNKLMVRRFMHFQGKDRFLNFISLV